MQRMEGLMKIHEYQAKDIFARYGIPVPAGQVATTVQEAVEIAEKLARPVMIKSSGSCRRRGKAGGIKYAENVEAAKVWRSVFWEWTSRGCLSRKFWSRRRSDITSETYVGIILDRATKCATIMVSAAGGVDIEEVAAKTPEKIHKLRSIPGRLAELPGAALAYTIFRDINLVRQVADIIMKLYKIFWKVERFPGGDQSVNYHPRSIR